jgi:UDP-glucose 4-epimerase
MTAAKRRALVTGGAGFIGSHLVERFVAEGYDVTVLDDMSRGRREHVPAGVPLEVCDIQSRDAARIVREGRFDVLVHLAAQMDVRHSVADPVHDASVNIVGTLNLLEAIRASGHATRFIFASTGGVLYGDYCIPPNAENIRKEPDSPYAIAKLSVEYYLAYYVRVHGLDATALRLGNVYGPRQDPHGEAGVVAIFCGRILEQEPLTVFGDGLQTRDYVHVRDVVDAILAVIDADLGPADTMDARSFNIGTGIGSPVLDLTRILLATSGSGVEVRHAPRRAGEQQHSFLNVAKAERVLGWRPRISLEDGLADTYRWFADRHAGAAAR